MIIVPPAAMVMWIAVAVSIAIAAAIAAPIVRPVAFAIAAAVVAAADGDPAAIAVAIATPMPPIAMSVGVGHPMSVARNSPDACPRSCSVNGVHGRRRRSMNGDGPWPMPDFGFRCRRTARAE
jgi:hypothetical protein